MGVNRIALRKQIDEWFPQISKLGLKITCGSCAQKVNFFTMYRCLYCGFLFCHTCAQKHFEINNIQRKENDDDN